jgi:hypothetical protein
MALSCVKWLFLPGWKKQVCFEHPCIWTEVLYSTNKWLFKKGEGAKEKWKVLKTSNSRK